MLAARCAKLEGQIEAEKAKTAAATINKDKDTLEVPKPTYAQKLAVPKIQKTGAIIKKPQNMILLRAKYPEQDKIKPEEIKEVVTKPIDLVKEGVQIKNVRKTKNGILIETNREEDINSFKKCEALSGRFEIERLRNRNARVIIYDVPIEKTAEDLGAVIVSQNPEVGLDQISKENFTPKLGSRGVSRNKK